ncbi:MAG: hypothetical protein AB7N69_01500 [Immundisolibacter sp.]|uniref:hypothetical protein n=1 Tax=Immundisolibacter sp. TaxID=1934948 RepID=UPI003D1438F0
MKDILEKISSYNIFNYLLPGVLFAIFGSRLTSLPLLSEDMVIGVFLYYFYGLVVSRVGSLILEPILKRFAYVRHEAYEKYVAAVRADSQLEVLSEVGNMYRTLAALFICLLATMLCEEISKQIGMGVVSASVICLVLFSTLFVISYRKQAAYISARVKAIREDN